ncbi:TRAP transporter small permease [Flavimarina sp. Hel_I_48]|uniref:TRAP transporter small permease n=1 Tax=Flavimarina sp. Hel_I_48 TaxID=1392488 RepID=UPI0004DF24B6|nr:TRAP transporter small permease [Flavimarina sp. Hel_I_48]
MKLKLDKILGGFLVFLMALMVCSVLWQVFSRYALNAPSSFTEEVARYLLIWIGILGAAYAVGQQAHLSIDILQGYLRDQNKMRLRIVINILIILFSIVVLIIGGGNLVYVNYLLGQYSASLNIPLGFVYAVVPLSGLLIVTYKLIELRNPKKYLI